MVADSKDSQVFATYFMGHMTNTFLSIEWFKNIIHDKLTMYVGC